MISYVWGGAAAGSAVSLEREAAEFSSEVKAGQGLVQKLRQKQEMTD